MSFYKIKAFLRILFMMSSLIKKITLDEKCVLRVFLVDDLKKPIGFTVLYWKYISYVDLLQSQESNSTELLYLNKTQYMLHYIDKFYDSNSKCTW